MNDLGQPRKVNSAYYLRKNNSFNNKIYKIPTKHKTIAYVFSLDDYNYIMLIILV